MRYRKQPNHTTWLFHFDGSEYVTPVRAGPGATHPSIGEYIRFHGPREPTGPWVVAGVQHAFIRNYRRLHIYLERAEQQ